ncbi:hypothetical protein EVG20_g1649 [Dentipellis fragilis]|uniref:DUF4470 domain-containing protein n=1 Tax=Dentipellis fragilis TaxID=205917 RepID=A0A4Y9Z9Y9_9AGAM|nr:hypothetical protein EVG20_g1649 [Dentipellis fragilis]
MSSREPGIPLSVILTNELPNLERRLECLSTREEKYLALCTFVRGRLPPEAWAADPEMFRRDADLTRWQIGHTSNVHTHPGYVVLLECHGLRDDYIVSLYMEIVPGWVSYRVQPVGLSVIAQRIARGNIGMHINKTAWIRYGQQIGRLHGFASAALRTSAMRLTYICRGCTWPFPVRIALTCRWGDLPAYDILKLPTNALPEDSNVHAVLSVASSDLRNLILTVNALPPDFPKHLHFILNDSCPLRLLRTFLIIQSLASIKDRTTAADTALHYWYSAFLPEEYATQSRMVMSKILRSVNSGPGEDRFMFSRQLTETANIMGQLNEHYRSVQQQYLGAHYGADTVHPELQHVRVSPLSIDRLHRRYCQVEPAHRQALHHFRKTGVLLPFGAATAHFKHPNRFLFSPEGKWIQDDLADPLRGWPYVFVLSNLSAASSTISSRIEDVMAAGKAHGVERGDVYGTLYFYLMGQLRTFIDRLHMLNIHFIVFACTASELAGRLRSGALAKFGIRAQMGFDIDAGTLGDMDPGAWMRVVLVGTSVKWAEGPGEIAEESRLRGEAVRALTGRLMQEGKIPRPSRERSADDVLNVIPAYESSFTAMYDNSNAFMKYIAVNLGPSLRNHGLEYRVRNSIVPHRLGAKVDAPLNALPDFSDAERWYLNVNLVGRGWVERSFEISRLRAAITAPEPQDVNAAGEAPGS